MIKKLILTTLCFLFLFTGYVYADPRWVDPSGTKTSEAAAPTGCQSATQLTGANACTGTYASANASAGETWYWNGGTYTGFHFIPAQSGTPGSIITHQASNSEDPPIFDGADNTGTGINLANRSYTTIDGFKIRRFSTGISDHSSVASTEIIVQNCTIQEYGVLATGNGIFARGLVDGFYIRNCTIDCSISHTGLGGIVFYGSSYGNITNTEVSGCTIIGAGSGYGGSDGITHHVSDAGGYFPGPYHIVKNNVVYGWKENCFDVDLDTRYDGSSTTTNYLVYRNNECSGPNFQNQAVAGTGHLRTRYADNIFRDQNYIGIEFHWVPSNPEGVDHIQYVRNRWYGQGNSLIFAGTDFWDTYSDGTPIPRGVLSNIYVAHNTYDGTHPVAQDEDGLFSFSRSKDAYLSNVNFKNNIFYYSSATTDIPIYWGNNVTPTNHKSDYNLFYDIDSATSNVWYAGGARTLAYVKANYGTMEDHSIETNPLFMDVVAHDYELQPSSLAINNGGWLTTITSANQGAPGATTFNVADAGWFYDGWGIAGETGDVIKTQNGQTATIVSINYTTGAIEVDSPITWTQNEGIGLYYNSTLPDIGAFEYGDEPPPLEVSLSNFYPPNTGTGIPTNSNLSFSSSAGVTDVDVYIEPKSGACDLGAIDKIVDGVDTEVVLNSSILTFLGLSGALPYNTEYCWQVVANPDADNITYGPYTFTTVASAPISPSNLMVFQYKSTALASKYNPSGINFRYMTPAVISDCADDANCFSVWQYEDVPGFAVDAKGSSDLTNSGADEENTTYKVGAQSAKFIRANGDYMQIADANQDTGFPWRYLDGAGRQKSFTFLTWVYFNSLPSTNTEIQYIAGRYHYTTTLIRVFSIVAHYLDDKLRFFVGFNSGASEESVSFGTAFVTGRWFHVAVSYDASTYAYRMRIWDDTAGNFLGSDATGNFSQAIDAMDVPFTLGARGDGNRELDGFLDNSVMFNRVLNATEIDAVRAGTYTLP